MNIIEQLRALLGGQAAAPQQGNMLAAVPQTVGQPNRFDAAFGMFDQGQPAPPMPQGDQAMPWNVAVGNSNDMTSPTLSAGAFDPPERAQPLDRSGVRVGAAFDAQMPAGNMTPDAVLQAYQRANPTQTATASNDSAPGAPLDLSKMAAPGGMTPPPMAGMGYDPSTGRVGTAPTANNGARLPAQGGASGGGLSGLFGGGGGFNRDAFRDMMLGFAMGATPQQSMAMAAAQMSEGRKGRLSKEEQNQTAAWLQNQGYSPEEARMIAGDRGLLQDAFRQRMGGKAAPKRVVINGKLVDESTGQVIGDYGDPEAGPKLTSDLQEYQAAKAEGYTGTFLDYQKELKRAGVSQTNVNVNNGENQFDEQNAKNLANRFDTLATQGQTARQNMGTIGILREQISSLPGGFVGGAQSIASQFGIKLGENASATEAASAIISQLVPAQRIPGSGTMSDQDLKLFQNSLPKLSNTPEGNKVILDTMQAMAEYQAQAGDIAEQAQMGAIGKEEAVARLKQLPDPMELFKKYSNSGTTGAASAPDAQGWSTLPGGIRIREVK